MNVLARILRLRSRPPCREVAEVLQSFLDGELPAEQAARVEAHLAHCARCGIDAQVYRDVTAALARLRQPADADAIARLHAFAHGLQQGDEPTD